MTSDMCYKCPRCGSIFELEMEDLNQGDGEETELECYDCGQKITCTAFVSIDYQFTVKDPYNEDTYNVGVALHHIFGTDFRRENYREVLEDEDEWEDIHRQLTEQEEEE